MITAQLINVADGYHLWSGTYKRELKDIFTVDVIGSRAGLVGVNFPREGAWLRRLRS